MEGAAAAGPRGRAGAEQRRVAAGLRGHAAHRGGAFHPLPPVQARIQHALADAFDPDHVFDRGRLWPAP
jgi:hypothetical protein